MVCLSTLTLGGLLAALFVAQIIRQDTRRAKMTFFMGALALALQHIGCLMSGNIGGWISFSAIVLLIVLVGLIHGGVFSSTPSILPDKCIPIPEPTPQGHLCAPACPLCPGEEACPIPDYLPY